MKVRMLVSLMVMPEFTILEDGQVYDLPVETGVQLCAEGNAVAEPASIEAAVINPPEQADAPAQRKRGKENR